MGLAARLLASLLLALTLVLPAHAVTFHRAEWSAAPLQGEPAADAVWTPVELPLRWSAAEGAPLRGVALRLHLELTAVPAEPWGILLATDSDGGRVSVNRHLVGVVPPPDQSTNVRWRRPHVLTIDPAQLLPGDNIIQIVTAYRAGAHELAGIEAGPLPLVWGDYLRRFFFGYTVAWVGATLAAVVALVFGVLWLRQHEALPRLMTCAALAWLVQSASWLAEVVPVDLRFPLRVLGFASMGAFAALITAILIEMSSLPAPRMRRLCAGYATAGPLLLLAWPQGAPNLLATVWIPGLLLMVAAGAGTGIYRRTRGLTAPNATVLTGALVLIGTGALDLAALLGNDILDGVRALHVTAPLVLVALAAPLVDAFVRVLREAETARAELETRVREREQLLKRNFERLRESERGKAEAQERQRIMQDMHDGLGSQLMSSLMQVERGAVSNEQVAQILRESIDDLRLAIDALAADQADLGSALGNLRFRMEPRFKAGGMELQWDARKLPEELGLHQDAVLPILRIVQEGLTNALKHSRARAVRVTLAAENAAEAPWLDIRVTDNGRGIAEERVGGRGLLNMRNRAQRIGAEFKLESLPGTGTMVHLRVRLEAFAGPTTRGQLTALNTQGVIERARAN